MLEERAWVAEMIELINVIANCDLNGATEFGGSARRRLAEVVDDF